MTQESRLLLPSLAAAYRIMPELDVGARFTAGNAREQVARSRCGARRTTSRSRSARTACSPPTSRTASSRRSASARRYRPTPNLELAAIYSSPIVIKAKGTASSVKAPGVSTRARDRPAARRDGLVRDRRHVRAAEGVHLAPAADDRDDRRSLQVPRRQRAAPRRRRAQRRLGELGQEVQDGSGHRAVRRSRAARAPASTAS